MPAIVYPAALQVFGASTNDLIAPGRGLAELVDRAALSDAAAE